MALADLDWVSVLLRTMIYVGTIAVVGGVLVRTTLDMEPVARTINWQICIGILILVVCEPLRYVSFQLSIAQGDWAMAFDPAMRWMAVETPVGHAAGMRLLGAGVVAIGFIWQPLAVVGAVLVVGSYLLEGHSVSSDSRALVAILLFAHLAVVHWWLGALMPLRAALTRADDHWIANVVEDFGRKAIISVVVLALAGAAMLAILSGWNLNLENAYQQAFAIKLSVFAAILLIAAINKTRWTPRLTSEPKRGQEGLRRSITLEVVVAFAILFATAVATSFPPLDH